MNEAAVFRPNTRRAFLVNRRIVNTAIGRDLAEALSEYPLPVLKSAICQRVAFAESAAQGLTVFDLDPGMPASQEVSAFANEVQELVA